MYLLQLKYHYESRCCQQSEYLIYHYLFQTDKLMHFLDCPPIPKMKNISITITESLFVENFYKFFTSRDTMKGNTVVYQNLCIFVLYLVVKEVNTVVRDKTSGSRSGDLTFGALKQLRTQQLKVH